MTDETDDTGQKAGEGGNKRREIKGNLTYTTTPGKTKDVLQAIIPAERPDKFTQNFLKDVLRQSGGSAMQQIPLLRAIGLLDASGTPTEIYSAFQQDSKRSAATVQALRKGYAELFRGNEQIHRADDNTLAEAIAAVTGMAKADRLVKTIQSTFNTIKSFITDPSAKMDTKDEDSRERAPPKEEQKTRESGGFSGGDLGLQYNINIVLPQSNNIEVYDMIFRSLRENILDWNK